MTRVWVRESVEPRPRGRRKAASLQQDGQEGGARPYALTVFQSPEIERFEIELVGDLPEGGAAGVDLVLARALGPRVDALGGVPAGTSGSPVYVNGRVIGAIAYAYPPDYRLVGITPIEAMRRLLSEPRSDRKDRLDDDGDGENARALGPVSAWEGGSSTPVANNDREGRRAGLRHSGDRFGWTSSSTPEGFSLHAPAARRPPWPAGLIPAAGGFRTHVARGLLDAAVGGKVNTLPGKAPRIRPAQAIVPGSAIGAALITGDLIFGAVGTATEVTGGTLLGFGHPAFFAGATKLALTEATIVTTAAGSGPLKIGYLGRTIGAVVQDRSAGILAVLGLLPRTVALELVITDEERQVTERLTCGLAPLPGWIGFLVLAAAVESFGRAMDRSGAGTAAWEWVVDVRDSESVRENGVSASVTDIAFAVAQVGEDLVQRLVEEGAVIERIRLSARVTGYRGPVSEDESGDGTGGDGGTSAHAR